MFNNLDVAAIQRQNAENAFYINNSYNNYITNNKKPQTRTLCADMQNLAIDYNILIQANELLATLPLSFARYTPKKQMILLALYEVHRRQGEAVDPFYLGQLLSLTAKQVRQAFAKYYSYVNTKDAGYVSPLDLITSTAKKLGCSDGLIREITEYSKLVIDKHKDLIEKNSQLVASALVVYYLDLSGYQLDLQKIAIELSPHVRSDYSNLDPKQINSYYLNLLNMVKIIQNIDNK